MSTIFVLFLWINGQAEPYMVFSDSELCGVALDLTALPGVLILATMDRADDVEWYDA